MPEPEPVPIPREEAIGLMKLVVSLMNEQSERALVIVSAAKLDALLREAVKLISPGGEFGFGKSVAILESLGLIDQAVASALKLLWEMRAKFAHDPNDRLLSDATL